MDASSVGACCEPLADEAVVGADEIDLAGVAEPGGLEHDRVQSLQVEGGRELADLLPVLVEEGCRDRDRRLFREGREPHGLDGGDPGARVLEVAFVGLGGTLVGRGRGEPYEPVLVEDHVLLGVGRLADDPVEQRAHRVVRVFSGGRGGAGCEQLLRQSLQLRVAARLGAPEKSRHEDDVAALVVHPAVDRTGLLLDRRVEASVDGLLQGAAGAKVCERPHGGHHQHGQHEERSNEADHQRPPRHAGPTRGFCRVHVRFRRVECRDEFPTSRPGGLCSCRTRPPWLRSRHRRSPPATASRASRRRGGC